MSLDSQLHAEEESEEQGRKPSLGWTLVYVSSHSSIGVLGFYQTGRFLAGEEIPFPFTESARYPIVGATGASSILLLSLSLLVCYGYLKNRKRGVPQ